MSKGRNWDKERQRKLAQGRGTAPAVIGEPPGLEYDVRFTAVKWRCFLCSEKVLGGSLEAHLERQHQVMGDMISVIVRGYNEGVVAPHPPFHCGLCGTNVDGLFYHFQTEHRDLDRGPREEAHVEPD